MAKVFETLAKQRSAALHGLAADELDQLAALGIAVAEGHARLDADIETLSAQAVCDGLDAPATAWLRDLDLRAHIDSTNTSLLARADREAIDGCVLAAEVQTAGRGRRGRTWLSPFGRNLAVSIGVGIHRPVAELGTLSLVAGVAMRQALLGCGIEGVELKWPNDVLLHGRKLAGILIELVRASPPVEVVIGIGVNVGCRDAIAARVDQAVADVAEQISSPSRNQLLAETLNRMAAACQLFNDVGFEPFHSQWERAHRHQGRAVTIATSAMNQPVALSGTALGVAADGSLRIDTGRGIREFSSGEVTLREA